MGTMSASDVAPLPRLGEVFFDVRGSARSMRLSWYADTGVAVFSIWQAGTCTGSFRLPMGELERMIETLRRAPDGRPPAALGRLAGRRGRAPGAGPAADDAATVFSDPQALGVWDDEEAGPRDYEVSGDHGDYPPSIGPYPASIGPLEYTGEHAQAHFLPRRAGPGPRPAPPRT